jgi:hypothetical protein
LVPMQGSVMTCAMAYLFSLGLLGAPRDVVR